MSGSAHYLDALESIREMFVDYPMRAEISSIHVAVGSTGQASVMVWLHTAEPPVLAAGIVEWRRTLVRGRTWVWCTEDGANLHVATTGFAPERSDLAVAVLAGPVRHDCRLEHDLEPNVTERLSDDALHRWLGDEVANNWPFPDVMDTQNGDIS